MMGDQLAGAGVGVGDRPPVPRVRHLAVEDEHPPQRLEILRKGGDAFAVGCELHEGVGTDTLQQQVSGDQNAVFMIEGDVPVGVPGRVERAQPLRVQGEVLTVRQRGYLRQRIEILPECLNLFEERLHDPVRQTGLGQEGLHVLEDPAPAGDFGPVPLVYVHGRPAALGHPGRVPGVVGVTVGQQDAADVFEAGAGRRHSPLQRRLGLHGLGAGVDQRQRIAPQQVGIDRADREGRGKFQAVEIHLKYPTPFPVGPVNAYLLRGDPLTLVDTGPKTVEAQTALERGVAAAGARLKDIRRILLTHGHTDHAGNAAWVAQRSGAPVHVHEGDRAKVSGRRWVLEHVKTFLTQAGLADSVVESFFEQIQALRQYLDPLAKVSSLTDGEYLPLDTERLRTLYTPGHSNGHVSFYHEDGVLIAADLLLECAC